MKRDTLVVEGNCEILVSWDDFRFDVGGKNFIQVIEDHFQPECEQHGGYVRGHTKKLGRVRITIEKLEDE